MKIKNRYGGLAPAFMTSKIIACSLGLAGLLAANCFAAGPYAPTNWPPTIDPTKIVHFGIVSNAVVDGDLLSTNSASTNATWTYSLGICAIGAGADQGVTRVGCLGPEGYSALRGGFSYFNIADTNFYYWTNQAEFDVLMLVYGDTGVLNAGNPTLPKGVRFQEGTSSSGYSTYTTPSGLQLFTTNAYDNRWSWMLFTVTNNMWSNKVDSLIYRQVGAIKPGSSPTASVNGGINGGTLRMQCADTSSGMAGWTVHAFAIGQKGAFGSTNDMNIFSDFRSLDCPPVPAANLVGIDFASGTSNNLVPVNNIDAVLEVRPDQGPAGDLRTAAVPIASNGAMGWLYNFGIVSNYLGLPCNNNAVFHICVDFYDDPAFAGAFPAVVFGPEAFAVDSQGCSPASVYPSTSLHTMTGSGKWIRQSWIVPNVNLYGVNVAPDYTAGPRLIAKFGQVAISRVDYGILRTGSDPLAGQDPLADCPLDPQVCEGVYTNYVELDLQNGIQDGLAIGTPGSDQNFVQEMAGPAGDQRMCVVADTNLANLYLQFQILNGAMGPNYQDNAHVAIVLTYYDDPLLKSNRFGIDAWRYRVLGVENIFAADAGKWVMLEGTGKWRDAYWEVDRMLFSGVNQAPQAAARIKCEGPVHVSRVRYAVIRTCGPNAGVNWLDQYRVKSLSVSPDTNGMVKLNWPNQEAQLTVQGSSDFSTWSIFAPTPTFPESEQVTVRLAPTNSSQFFRLYRPPIP